MTISTEHTLSRTELREALGHFATGVAVVTSFDGDEPAARPLLHYRGAYAHLPHP